MKPAALAALLIAFGILGSLLVAATPEDGQAPVAAVVAISLALALGGLWPVHREFTLAGVAVGFLFAVGISIYITVGILTNDSIAYEHMGRSRFLLSGISASFAIFGGWTFVMMIGAAAGWLAHVLVRRSAIASGSS